MAFNYIPYWNSLLKVQHWKHAVHSDFMILKNNRQQIESYIHCTSMQFIIYMYHTKTSMYTSLYSICTVCII